MAGKAAWLTTVVGIIILVLLLSSPIAYTIDETKIPNPRDKSGQHAFYVGENKLGGPPHFSPPDGHQRPDNKGGRN
ncbi:hypothetical protein GH714_041969 [Hevea brasiliensis]|uniref:Uncharacterized protein n=1 Tax=Hevea brasiliensis TaxID=3981 RepID=A0A6A6MW54_HEVBR|nr:hypothetical protein GH714_041969 [Hevea brasiliensis]